MLSILYKDSMIQQIRIFQNYLQQIKESSVNVYSDGSNGSGFLYRNNGTIYCITAAHVISSRGSLNNNTYLSIYSTDSHNYEKVSISQDNILYNIYFDIAIITIDNKYNNNLTFSIIDSRQTNLLGGLIYAVGNPLTLDTNSFSFGCLRDNLYNYLHSNGSENNILYESITFNAATYPGNSGGMILYVTESNVQIVGMSQFGFINNDGTSSENFGGGISSTMMNFLIDNMLKGENKGGEYKFPILKLQLFRQ